MSEHRKRMVEDFSRHLQERIQEVLNRELRLASAVYDQPEIAMITLDLARGIALGWAAHCLMVARPGIDLGEMYDQLMGPFASGLVDAKAQVLARIVDPGFRKDAQL